jgi:hypothetical protein
MFSLHCKFRNPQHSETIETQFDKPEALTAAGGPKEDGKPTMKGGKKAKASKGSKAAKQAKGKKDKPAAKAKKAKPDKTQRPSLLNMAAQVLAGAKKPMNAKELVEKVKAQKLWESPAGKTPHATLSAAIMKEIETKGKESRFRKMSPGHWEHTGK